MGLTMQQLEARRSSIGSSDAPAVLGVSKWRKPIDVWAEKTGVVPIDESRTVDSPRQEWGRLIEPVLVAKAAEELGLRSRKGRFRRHPVHRFLTATPDATLLRGDQAIDELVEAKTTGVDEGWGDTGTDEIPLQYKVQAVHQAVVTGANVVHVPVLIRGQDFRLFRIEPSQAERDALLTAEVDFWHDYVETGIEPPEPSAEYVRSRWPVEAAGKELVATDDLLPLIERFRSAKRGAKTAAALAGELAVQLQRRMEDAEKLVHPYGSITWRQTRPHTDWKLVAAAYRDVLGRIYGLPKGIAITPDLRFDLDALVGLHTGEGSRVFRATWKKEGDLE